MEIYLRNFAALIVAISRALHLEVPRLAFICKLNMSADKAGSTILIPVDDSDVRMISCRLSVIFHKRN